MGRRAKNKQSAPEPLAEARPNVAPGKPSAKKLGKRKADVEDDAPELSSKRPAKKARESEGGEKKKSAKKNTASAAKGTKTSTISPGKTKRRKVDEEAEEGGDSSEGWEDVDDKFDVKKEAKWVLSTSSTYAVIERYTGRYSAIATTKRSQGSKAT